MKENGINGHGHNIGETFQIGDLMIKLTPADHTWQNSMPNPDRLYLKEDFCGFWIDTPDGNIWIPGDSKLIEEQLHMPDPDVILFDFSDNEWHIGLDVAVKMADAYPNADLMLSHWGCVDAPDMTPFNGKPQVLYKRIINPGRIKELTPGEKYILTGRKIKS
jgi:L-ascorbate metabolism protein UlaG (beta-lactamase superfamily)